MKKNFFWIILILLFPLFILLPHLNGYVYPALSTYSDLTITHVPNIITLKTSILRDGIIPFWSENILSGYPFAANPLSSLWYPPAWLLIPLPMPFGFNLLILLHLWLSGIGMYLFLRSTGAQELPALIGGLAFELTPKVFSHYGAGHITLLFALSWTPWLLWAVNLSYKTSSIKQWSPLAGFCFGMILLADIRWGLYACLLWAGYVFYREFLLLKIQSSNHFQIKGEFTSGFIKRIGRWGLDIVSGLCLSAPLLVLLQQYTSLSTRNTMNATDQLILALKPSQLLGFIIPNMAGYAEWVIYPGILVMLLFLCMIAVKSWQKKNIFWVTVFLIAVVLSLGENIPLVNSIVRMPGMSLLRVPTRFMFLAEFALAVISCNILDSILGYKSEDKPISFFNLRLTLVGFCAFVILLTIGVWYAGKVFSLSFIWASVFVLIFTVLLLVRIHFSLSSHMWTLAIITFFVLDILTVDYTQIKFLPATTVFGEGADAAQFLIEQPGIFRTYSPSYSLPQQTAAFYGIQLADGIDPMQLESYVNYMHVATGVPSNGYSVTVPTFATGHPETDNENYLPDLNLLGLLNVKYIVSAFDINLDGLILEYKQPGLRIYENSLQKPRAWIQAPNTQIGQNIIPAIIKNRSPNQIDIEGRGPGLLLLSEIYYPGWKARVDGLPVKVFEVAGIFRGIMLSEGIHKISFVYFPERLWISLGVSGFYILILLAWLGIVLKKKAYGHKI